MKRKEINIRREEVNIEINGGISKHLLYVNEKSTNLVVVFPGGNNNSLTPFLYYLRDYFIHNDYDLLRISYENLVKKGDSSEEQISKISFAVHQAIMNNRKSKMYQNYIFVSRSIGNIFANKIKTDYEVNVIKNIYINPTSEAFEDIQKDAGLIITATNDDQITKDEIKAFLSNQNQEVLIFEDGDHFLECENTVKSVEFCKEAVSKVIEFVSK